jgi:hypothetical protein
MSTSTTEHQPYRLAVAGEIRARMARLGITNAEMTELLQVTYPTWLKRIKGRAAFDIDELEIIARRFDCEIADLIVIQRYPVDELALAS